MINSKSLYIGSAINELIKNIAPTFPLIAEEGTTYPFIVYKRNNLTPYNTKDIYNYQELASIEIVIADTNYKNSLQLAVKVKERLEHYRGTVQGIDIADITLVSSSEEWIGDAYIQRLNFNIVID